MESQIILTGMEILTAGKIPEEQQQQEEQQEEHQEEQQEEQQEYITFLRFW